MNRWLVSLLWMGTGLLSWCLAIYLFHFVISPLLIEPIRAINAGNHSLFVKHASNMLFSHMAAFILCFFFAFFLSLYSEVTKLRWVLFVIGAVAVSLYLHVESVIGYWRQYSEIPSWAKASIMQGFTSSLLIVPLLSLGGSKAGNCLKGRKQNS